MIEKFGVYTHVFEVREFNETMQKLIAIKLCRMRLVKKKIQDGRLTNWFWCLYNCHVFVGEGKLMKWCTIYVSVKISNLRWLVRSVAILISNSNSTFIVLNHCPKPEYKVQETKHNSIFMFKDIARVTHYGKQSSILMETMGICLVAEVFC